MRRLLRMLLNFATACCLIMLAAVIALWVRSYIYSETLDWYGDQRELSLMSARGEFDCYRVWAKSALQPTEFTVWRFPNPQGFESRANLLKTEAGMSHIGPIFGFACFHNPHPNYAERFAEIMLPWWSMALLTAALPVIRLRRWWKRKPFVSGLCRSCGYDLRATPERCPECGKVQAVKA